MLYLNTDWVPNYGIVSNLLQEQIWIVGILFMVPVYATESVSVISATILKLPFPLFFYFLDIFNWHLLRKKSNALPIVNISPLDCTVQI